MGSGSSKPESAQSSIHDRLPISVEPGWWFARYAARGLRHFLLLHTGCEDGHQGAIYGSSSSLHVFTCKHLEPESCRSLDLQRMASSQKSSI